MTRPTRRELPPRLATLFAALTALKWDRVEELDDSVQTALNFVCDETVPGEANDPTSTDANAMWLWLVHAVVQSPPLAIRVARRWYRAGYQMDSLRVQIRDADGHLRQAPEIPLDIFSMVLSALGLFHAERSGNAGSQ